jgi:carboxylesterase
MRPVVEKQPYGVLIIHGFRSSLDCVSGLVAPLEALGLPCRMPLLRGHGEKSPEALRGVTWHDWMVDAEAALQTLLTAVDRVIIVGHSMGGLVALWLAPKYANQVDSVVVAAVPIQMTSPFAPGRAFYCLVPFLMRVIKQWTLPAIYADLTLAETDTKYPWVPTDAIAALFEFAQKTRGHLSAVKVPTLIMQSRNDSTVAPESAEIVFQNISTPLAQKRILWFELTEHEMFRDCERESTIQAVVNYVRERINLSNEEETPDRNG